MIKRKELLKAAFNKDSPVPPQTTYPTQPGSGTRVPSGAVRAMGLSLGRIGEDASRAEALAQQLARGEFVHELDPQSVDPSFVDDRIDRTSDPDFRRLVDSINHSGQQVPILVRPHPEGPDRYQVAYGHRRLSACMELGLQVKALVRSLSDAELVIAQGKENAERRNLSFIERATFAAHLDQQGFDRATIQTAMAVHPAEMTRLLSVARTVPAEFITAIGSAPRAGRPRWMELADLLARPDSSAVVRTLIAQPSFKRAGSDGRFDLVIDHLRSPKPETSSPTLIRDREGRPIIKAERGATWFRLLVDVKLAPGLDQFLLEKLPEILADFPTT